MGRLSKAFDASLQAPKYAKNRTRQLGGSESSLKADDPVSSLEVASVGAVESQSLTQINASTLNYPRLALVWQGNQDAFRDYSRAVHLCCNAEYAVFNPFPSLYNDYRVNVNAALVVNPNFKAIRYINPLENNNDTPTELAALQLFDNPNRGGADTAGDGLCRNASGAQVGTGFGGAPPAGNTGTNVTNFITPYTGTPASGDSDRTKPKTNERAIDYAIRAEYFRNIDPIKDYIHGGFFDVSNRYDVNEVPSSSDYDNSGNNREIPAADWQAAIARQAYVMFGDNLEGIDDTVPTLNGGASAARSTGKPWYDKDNVPLVSMNGIDWEGYPVKSNGLTETWNWLDGDPAPAIAAPLVNVAHGNLVEFAFGGGASDSWLSGINEEGTANVAGGSFPNCVDVAIGQAYLRDRHAKIYSVTDRTMISIECRARNYWAASHFFSLVCLTTFLANMRDDSGFSNGGFNFVPFGLDEHVGGNWALMTEAQVAAKKGWMGQALTPAWPNLIKTDGVSITSNGQSNSVGDSGAVWVREFQNALVLVLPGKSYYKNDLYGVGDAGATLTGAYNFNEVVNVDMTLFPPGVGYKWQRINGSQQPSWNDGTDVGSSITLGTTSQNVNQNSIILKRVDV